MYKSSAFSQAVLVQGGQTLYIGGQNGIQSNGKIISDSFGEQTEQALKNVIEILKSVGGTQENVMKLTLYVAKGQDIRVGFAVSQKIWGNVPTAITSVFVDSLTVPGALIEIEAVAVIDS